MTAVTMPGDYSEELVRELAEIIHADHWWDCDHSYQPPDGCAGEVARAVLAALSSSGRLVPEGSENACPKCGEDARAAAEWAAEKAAMSPDELHARFIHPGYEYLTVTVGRKSGADDRPPDDTWEPNDFIDMGSAPDGTPYPRRNWERFDYTEETYYRRRTPSEPTQEER